MSYLSADHASMITDQGLMMLQRTLTVQCQHSKQLMPQAAAVILSLMCASSRGAMQALM